MIHHMVKYEFRMGVDCGNAAKKTNGYTCLM